MANPSTTRSKKKKKRKKEAVRLAAKSEKEEEEGGLRPAEETFLRPQGLPKTASGYLGTNENEDLPTLMKTAEEHSRDQPRDAYTELPGDLSTGGRNPTSERMGEEEGYEADQSAFKEKISCGCHGALRAYDKIHSDRGRFH